MMILVDTSVWIDFFRENTTPQAELLNRFLVEGEVDICTCGIILAEVLQGIRNDRMFIKTKDYFDQLIYLPENRKTFILSADIYRSLRKQGITIRKPVDCMIASVSLCYDVELLHSDRDFDPIEKHMGLKTVQC